MKQFIACTHWSTARQSAPWAAKLVKVHGGFLAFESLAAWQAWQRQG